MTNQAGSPDPRRGALGRVTAGAYLLLVVELAFLLAALPGLAGLMFVAREAGNLPLIALCLVPLAPAFSAAVSATRVARREDDLVVWPRFWRGWRRNLREVLSLWVPALVLGTVLGYNIVFGPAIGVDDVFIIASWILLAVLALWVVNAIMIASFFSFRLRDTARLALYYLAARPLVTLGTISLLVIAAGLVYLTADWVLAVCGSLFAVGVLTTHKPLLVDVEERFTTR